MPFGNQYGVDLAAIGQAQDQNALHKYQIAAAKREDEGANALKQYAGPAIQGDQEALGKVMAANPTAGVSLMNSQRLLDQQRRERAQKEAPIVGRALEGVKDQESYDQAIATLKEAGIANIDKAPPAYDPAWVGRATQVARAFSPLPRSPKTVELDEGAGKIGIYSVNTDGSKGNRIGDARPHDQPTTEIYDPKSPTGTTIVSRPNAIGQPGKPASGLTFKTGADGTVEVTQGRVPGGNGTGFGQAGNNEIDKALINNTMRLQRVGDIMSSYDPSNLTVGAKVTNWTRAQLEKIDPAMLNEDQKKELADFTTFRARAFDDLNKYLKETSGTAVTENEMQRSLKVMQDAENDSPTQFIAKTREIYRTLRMAQARLMYLKQKGIAPGKDFGGVGLDRMPKLIEEREASLVGQVRKQNPASPTLICAARSSSRYSRSSGFNVARHHRGTTRIQTGAVERRQESAWPWHHRGACVRSGANGQRHRRSRGHCRRPEQSRAAVHDPQIIDLSRHEQEDRIPRARDRRAQEPLGSGRREFGL
jgi:hypothetical protein